MKRGVFACAGLAALVLGYASLTSRSLQPLDQKDIYTPLPDKKPLKSYSPSFKPVPSDEERYTPLVSEQNIALYADTVLAMMDKSDLDQSLLSAIIEGLPQRYTCLIPGYEGAVFLRNSENDIRRFRKILQNNGEDTSLLDRLSFEEDCFEHPYYKLFSQNPIAQLFRRHLGNYFTVRQTLISELEEGDTAFTEEDVASYYVNVLSHDLVLLAQQPQSDAQHSFLYQALEVSDSDSEASEKIDAWQDLFSNIHLSF